MFTLTESFLMAGIGQGALLTVALRFFKEQNKGANHILSSMILIAMLMLIGRMAVMHYQTTWIWRIAAIADTTIFLFGPLLYTYARRSILIEPVKFRLKLSHFLPAILHTIYAVVFIILQYILQFDIRDMSVLGYLYFGIELMGLVSVWVYIMKSTHLLKITTSKEEEKGNKHLSNAKNFLTTVLIILGVIAGAWSFNFLAIYFFPQFYGYVSYDMVWVVISAFIYLIGYYCLQQPELFKLSPPSKKVEIEVKKVEETTIRLSQREATLLAEKLSYIMTEEKPFLDNELSLNVLAEKVGSTSNNLSWLLNQIHGKKFYDYVNEFRIKEFLKRVENNALQKSTILGLAMDVGFNSKSTFNKVFKHLLKETPTAYIKRKKEV